MRLNLQAVQVQVQNPEITVCDILLKLILNYEFEKIIFTCVCNGIPLKKMSFGIFGRSLPFPDLYVHPRGSREIGGVYSR